jgi:hypothetical protein
MGMWLYTRGDDQLVSIMDFKNHEILVETY